MKLRDGLVCLLVSLFLVTISFAQDPVKVDPKHYKVETENPQVRVLRIHYGPHEKGVMHSHPASVVVFLTDNSFNMTTPDGKTQAATGKAGESYYEGPTTHLPENTSDKDFEAIQVELKNPRAAAGAKKQ